MVAIGSRAEPGSSPAVLEYMQLLLADIQQQAASPGPLETVFFGGGTPSLVPPHLLAQVMDRLQQKFGISTSAEVSMEADPGELPVRLHTSAHKHCLAQDMSCMPMQARLTLLGCKTTSS